VLSAILFIPDPFRRLMRSSARNARICSSSNSSSRRRSIQIVYRTFKTETMRCRQLAIGRIQVALWKMIEKIDLALSEAVQC
jgi:hypothetical protein